MWTPHKTNGSWTRFKGDQFVLQHRKLVVSLNKKINYIIILYIFQTVRTIRNWIPDLRNYILCFRFLWPCIVSKLWREKTNKMQQLDVLLLTSVSACFGHHYARNILRQKLIINIYFTKPIFCTKTHFKNTHLLKLINLHSYMFRSYQTILRELSYLVVKLLRAAYFCTSLVM